MGLPRKDSSSSAQSLATSVQNANVIWHNVGIPCPTSTVEDALLQANYAAFYQSDTYNEISAVAADFPVAHPTLDPKSSDYIGYAMTGTNKLAAHHGRSKSDAGCECPAIERVKPQQRSKSDAGCECPVVERAKPQQRSKSDAGFVTDVPFDLSTPWNPTFPPYSKYYKPAPKNVHIPAEEEDDGSGVGRPQAYAGQIRRVSELIDPYDLVPENRDRFGSFSSVSSSSYSGTSSPYNSRSRSTSPASSASSSRYGSRKGSLADSIKPLPPVLESPSGALFSASEFAAHPNRPLAIRERQEHIRAAIESLDAQTRQARNESRKGSADSASSGADWKTGFGSDSRKGSLASAAYGGFGVDNRPAKTLEQMRIEEGRKAYEEKHARKEKGERKWSFSVLRGRK